MLERAVENEPRSRARRPCSRTQELTGSDASAGRSALGLLLGAVARVWLATLRLRLVVHPELARYGDVPWVLSFFHGTQWPLLAWRRRRPTLVMVSHSADGAIQARALGLLGFRVVRGSSSREVRAASPRSFAVYGVATPTRHSRWTDPAVRTAT